MAHREHIVVDLLDVLRAVDRHGGGPPDRGVVERRRAAVEEQAAHVRLADDVRAVVDVGVVLVAPELEDDLRGVGDHDVDGARFERFGAGVLIDDRFERDLVEMGEPGPPVVGVGRGREVAVGHPLLEDERTGSHRLGGPPVLGGQHGGGAHVGGLPPDTAGQVQGERHPG